MNRMGIVVQIQTRTIQTSRTHDTAVSGGVRVSTWRRSVAVSATSCREMVSGAKQIKHLVVNKDTMG